MKTLAQWLKSIEQGHPTEIDMGLGRVNEVAQRLGLSFDTQKVITVAGTNGKGTTCRLIEQFCIRAKLRVGVYSSPHILQFNERIRIQDNDVSDAQLCEAFQAIEQAKQGVTAQACPSSSPHSEPRPYLKPPQTKATTHDPISLSYFEYATLAALFLFAEAELDVVILEVGLGGRLDATNIIDADINVLTSIGLDHQDYLGDTLDEIAFEKMGIVKANKLTVVGYDEAYPSAEKYLAQQNNMVLRRGIDFSHKKDARGFTAYVSYKNNQQLYHWCSESLPAQNVATALATLRLLDSSSDFTALGDLLNDSEAVTHIIDSCQLSGRAQVLSTAPIIMLDVAHNQAACAHLRAKLNTFDFENCHIVVGMLKDKNIEQCLLCFSDIQAHWYCASLPEPRGEQYSRLLDGVPQKNALSFAGFDSIDEALSCATEQVRSTDLILVFGSFISVAHATSYFNKHSTI